MTMSELSWNDLAERVAELERAAAKGNLGLASENARLRAANAGLLAALEALVDRDVSYQGSEIRIACESHYVSSRLVAEARAAIAKVRGI